MELKVEEVIKLRRKKLGITQRQLAQKVGCGEITICRLEQGENIGIRLVEKILDELKIKLVLSIADQ